MEEVKRQLDIGPYTKRLEDEVRRRNEMLLDVQKTFKDFVTRVGEEFEAMPVAIGEALAQFDAHLEEFASQYQYPSQQVQQESAARPQKEKEDNESQTEEVRSFKPIIMKQDGMTVKICPVCQKNPLVGAQKVCSANCRTTKWRLRQKQKISTESGIAVTDQAIIT